MTAFIQTTPSSTFNWGKTTERNLTEEYFKAKINININKKFLQNTPLKTTSFSYFTQLTPSKSPLFTPEGKMLFFFPLKYLNNILNLYIIIIKNSPYYTIKEKAEKVLFEERITSILEESPRTLHIFVYKAIENYLKKFPITHPLPQNITWEQLFLSPHNEIILLHEDVLDVLHNLLFIAKWQLPSNKKQELIDNDININHLNVALNNFIYDENYIKYMWTVCTNIVNKS